MQDESERSVAHDEAADSRALLDAAVTVGADGVVREIALAWDTRRFAVGYSDLGRTLHAPRRRTRGRSGE
jgi:hypothetical protein